MPSTSAKEPAFSALLPCHAHTGGPSVPSLILTYEALRVHEWTDLPHRSLIRFYFGLIIFSFILQKWVIVILLNQYRALYSWNDLKHSVTYFPFGTSTNKNFGASHPRSATQRAEETKPVNPHWDDTSRFRTAWLWMLSSSGTDPQGSHRVPESHWTRVCTEVWESQAAGSKYANARIQECQCVKCSF